MRVGDERLPIVQKTSVNPCLRVDRIRNFAIKFLLNSRSGYVRALARRALHTHRRALRRTVLSDALIDVLADVLSADALIDVLSDALVDGALRRPTKIPNLSNFHKFLLGGVGARITSLKHPHPHPHIHIHTHTHIHTLARGTSSCLHRSTRRMLWGWGWASLALRRRHRRSKSWAEAEFLARPPVGPNGCAPPSLRASSRLLLPALDLELLPVELCWTQLLPQTLLSLAPPL